jgi:hypothetical protein
MYRNFKFLQGLPTGLVCLATNQIAGRGEPFVTAQSKPNDGY